MQVDVGQLTHESVKGVLRVLGLTHTDLVKAQWGVGYGAVLGAAETGADLVKVVQQAIEAAKSLAREQGMSQEEAALFTARGAIAAADVLGPEVVATVRKALAERLPGALLVSEAEAKRRAPDDGGS